MKSKAFVVKALLINVAASIMPFSIIYAETFNSSLLVGASAEVDWNDDSISVAPGAYECDVYVNRQWRGKFILRIVENSPDAIYLQTHDIEALGISGLEVDHDDDDVALTALLHGGTSNLQVGEMKLMLEVPQAYVEENSQNWVNPDKWDKGINGLYSSYNASYYDVKDKHGGSGNQSAFLTLRSGLNIAGWHVRDASTFNYEKSSGSSDWRNSSRFVERPLPELTSVVSAGERYTTSSYFDSIRFRGLSLDKDARMLPDKDHTYMPVVRGEASTSAVIVVLQDGHAIYQMTVPPGPFAIRDLMPTGSRSDLEVEVRNSGGKTERFVVPFATMAEMMRPGSDDYHLNIGQVRIDGAGDSALFGQASYSRGINNYWTLFGGVTGSEDYRSYLLGSAVSLPYLGSLSTNIEYASYDWGGAKKSGEKYSISYSKYFATETNLTLANYYYRSKNYLSFSDYVSSKGMAQEFEQQNKQVFSVSLAQNLPEPYGRFTLDAYVSDYWSDIKASKQYSLSYNNNVGSISYSLSFRRSDYDRNYYVPNLGEEGYLEPLSYTKRQSEDSAYLSITMPFTLFDSPASLTARTSFANNGYQSTDIGMSGVQDEVDYSLSASHDREGNTKAVDLYGSWGLNNINLNAGLSEASEYRQISLGASGSLLAYAEDVLFTADSGNTFVILDALGVEDAVINGDERHRTDENGRALVSSAVAYRMNDFMLENSEKANSDVDILGNIARVAPYDGSIINIKYRTDTRKNYIMDVKDSAGNELPFGASVYDQNGQEIGYVAQGGQLYIKSDGLPERISIKSLKNKNSAQCSIDSISENNINLCK